MTAFFELLNQTLRQEIFSANIMPRYCISSYVCTKRKKAKESEMPYLLSFRIDRPEQTV